MKKLPQMSHIENMKKLEFKFKHCWPICYLVSHYVSCFQRITTGGREDQELQRFRANRTKYLQIFKRLKNSSEALKLGEG